MYVKKIPMNSIVEKKYFDNNTLLISITVMLRYVIVMQCYFNLTATRCLDCIRQTFANEQGLQCIGTSFYKSAFAQTTS